MTNRNVFDDGKDEDEAPVVVSTETEIAGLLTRTLKVHSLTAAPRTVVRLGGTKAPSTQKMESEHPGLKRCYRGVNLQNAEESDNQVLRRYLAVNVLRKAVLKRNLGYRAQMLLEQRLKNFGFGEEEDDDAEQDNPRTSSKEVLLVTRRDGMALLKSEIESADMDAQVIHSAAVSCLRETSYEDMSHRLLLRGIDPSDRRNIVRRAVVYVRVNTACWTMGLCACFW